MRIEFHRTGAERKALVNALGEILGIRPKYKGMPSAAYEIGTFTVTRDGVLEYDDSFPDDEMENLVERLADRGIAAAPAEMAQAWLAAREAELSGEGETEPQEANVGLTVEIPLGKVNVGNLTSILDAKGHLIRKALGIDSTPIEITEDTVSFPWFSELPEPDAVHAYTHLISALCEMSVNQKRIIAKEKEVENEKYAFRCFLLRLGFIGVEYKAERKILLQNLSGNCAFKSKAETLRPEPVNPAMRIDRQEHPDITDELLDEMLIQQVNNGFGGDGNGISE